MKTGKYFFVSIFLISQIALWIFWRNSNFNLAVDLDEMEQQQQSLTLDIDRQQQRLTHLSSLSYLTAEADRLGIAEVRNFWELPSSAIASLPTP